MNINRMTGIAIAACMAGAAGLAQAATFIGNADPNGNNVANGAAVVTSKPDAAALQAATAAAQDKVNLINRIVDRFQPEAASQYTSGFDAVDWRSAFGARLMHQPASVLATALGSANLSSAQSVLATRTSGTLKHGPDNNLTMNFLANPCRIVDTRFGGGGLLGPSARYWAASDTPANIGAQGGNPAGCGTFSSASAWFLNVTVVPTGAVGSGGANFLTVRHDSGVPTTSTMTYYPGTILSNFALTLNQTGVSGGGFYAYASLNTHVVIDLVGWAGTPTGTLTAVVDANGTLNRGTGALGVTHTAGSGSYIVQFNQDVTNCTYEATIGLSGSSGTSGRGFITVVGAAAGADRVFVTTNDTAMAVAERGFHLLVKC